jgi:uncharacterized protein
MADAMVRCEWPTSALAPGTVLTTYLTLRRVARPFSCRFGMPRFAGMTVDTAALARVCERNDIVRLRLFGSAARGESRPDSDVDLLADFSSRKSLLDLVRIEEEFEEVLGQKVDLLTEAGLSPYLKPRILDEARVVYERAA